MTALNNEDLDEFKSGPQIKVTKGKKKTSKAEGDGKELPPASE